MPGFTVNREMTNFVRFSRIQCRSTFLSDHGGNPNKRNGDDESSIHCICRVGQAKSPSTEERRTMCISMMLMWRGPMMKDGEKERPQLNAQDKLGNTALHYAAASGLHKCVEMLVSQGAGLFIENMNRVTSCDMAVKAEHHQIAAYLESHMVFADATDNGNENVGLHTVNSENGSDEGDSEVYAGLRAQDLQEAKDQLLVETADMLHVPLFTAEALLRDNEWSKTLLLEKWMSNALQCCETAGIAPPTSSPSPPAGSGSSSSFIVNSPPSPSIIPGHTFLDSANTNKKVLCEICYNDMSSSDINSESPSCGHKFCSSCWECYLTLKIQEGGSHHILCPAVNCNILVDVDFIEKMVSPAIARKYLQFDIEAFVERNKTIKWCPLPGCGRAVRYPEAELNLRPFFFSNLNSSSITSHAVDCGNGHFFCWECLGEAHSPCGCDQWLKWQSKIAEIRPEELKISSGETEDAANFLWLVTNSKPCPNCKSPIQKNEGCNHMKCSKCKYVFCWVCLESWKKHSSATGGYFRCNRYDVQGKMDEKLGVLVSEASVRNKEMQELSRFIHFYTRYKNHQNSVKLEEPLLKSAKGKMALLAKSLPSQEKQKEESIEKGIRFIEEGIKELLKCRRVLCGSYVYGYYLLDNGYNKSVFEYLQNELEEIVEKLSDMVAREYLVTPRGQIIATTLLARRRRHKLVHAVSGGLLPPDTPSGLRKGKRRRISSLMGMDASSAPDALGVMERVLDLSQPWVKDNSGKHTNLAALLDWPDFDSEDDDCNLDQSLTLTLLGKCSRKNCPRPRARNPQTGIIHDFCSLSCTQSAKFVSSNIGTDLCTNTWEGCDSSMELLIALEMSRLQMIEDEARRRQSWLQERSKEHRIEHLWSNSPSVHKEQRWPRSRFRSEYLSDYHNGPSTSSYFGSVDDLHESYKRHQCNTSFSLHSSISHSSCTPLTSNHNSEYFTGSHANKFSSSPLSTAEIAVDYFLKKLSNNEISLRNINFDTEQDHKVEKDLFCFAKKGHENVDGRFKYGDLHENGLISSIFPSSDIRRDLRRSQSLGDLTDRSSEHELQLDSDHAYQDYPEASSKLHLTQPLTNQRDSSLDIESGSGEGDIEWTDQGAPSDVMGELESPLTDMEVRGILSQMDVVSQTLNLSVNGEPSFQLIVDEGTDKEESNSTEQSSSSQAQNKISNLRIHISHPNSTEQINSNEFESETGIPNSPTLYISGVSISRSPEPRSPHPLSRENTSPSLSLPLCRTPEPRFGNRLETSPLPLYTRSRSSSLIVPSTATTAAHLDPHYVIPRNNDKFTLGGSIHLSSLSLQATRASSPFLLTELRVSRSASETEKGRLVFQFPKSPTEGALSSILHVEESNLSSDDFHEALFLGKSPRPSKRKKSKRERNRDKDRPLKLEDNKGKERTKEMLGNKEFIDKYKDIKDRRKAKENLTVA